MEHCRHISGQLANSRVDIHIDNCVLESALGGDGCTNSAINDIAMDIFCCSHDFNFSIQTFYISPSLNPVDEPSQNLSDLYCMLTPET